MFLSVTYLPHVCSSAGEGFESLWRGNACWVDRQKDVTEELASREHRVTENAGLDAEACLGSLHWRDTHPLSAGVFLPLFVSPLYFELMSKAVRILMS